MKKINSFSTTNLILLLVGVFAFIGVVIYLSTGLFKKLSVVDPNIAVAAATATTNTNGSDAPVGLVDKIFTKYTVDFSQIQGLTLSIISKSGNDLSVGKTVLPKHAAFILNYYNQNSPHSILQIHTTGFPEFNNSNLLPNKYMKSIYQVKQVPVNYSNIKNFTLNCDRVYADDNNVINQISSSIIDYNLNLITPAGTENINIYKSPNQLLIYSFKLSEKKNYQLTCKNSDELLQNINNFYSAILN